MPNFGRYLAESQRESLIIPAWPRVFHLRHWNQALIFFTSLRAFLFQDLHIISQKRIYIG